MPPIAVLSHVRSSFTYSMSPTIAGVSGAASGLQPATVRPARRVTVATLAFSSSKLHALVQPTTRSRSNQLSEPPKPSRTSRVAVTVDCLRDPAECFYTPWETSTDSVARQRGTALLTFYEHHHRFFRHYMLERTF